MSPQRPNAPAPLQNYRPLGQPPHQGPRKGPPLPKGGLQPEPRRARAHGSGLLKGLLFAVLALFLVAGAGAGYLLLNPPSDLIRQRIAEQVKAKTGRDLIISGPSAFTIYPYLGVSLKDVSLSAPAGMSGQPLVAIGEMNIAIKALPLVNREISVNKLLLKDPVFDLRVDKSGRKNWNFAETPSPVRYAQARPAAPAAPAPQVESDAPDAGAPAAPAAEAESPQAGRLAQIKELQLGDVKIVNGTFRFTDERTGRTQEVSSVDAGIELKSLNGPLSANGNLTWAGENIDFDGKLANAKIILEEKPARLVFNASGEHIKAAYEGTVLLKDGTDLDGQITASSPSMRKLVKWLGTPLPPVAGFGPLTLSGNLKTADETRTLSNAKLTLDGATATGTVSLTKGAIRPYVQANLQITELDLNKYMGGDAAAATGEAEPPAPKPVPARPAAPAPAAPAPKPDGDAIEQLLNEKGGPKVHGFTQRAGWSGEPVNLTLLGVADADVKLQVGKLLFQQIKVGQSAMTVALKNRFMKANFDDVQLYEGHGKGFITLDGTGKGANIGANIALDGVSAQPLLKDAADLDWLSGKAKLGLQLAANGASELQLVEALNGRADFAFANGAISGFNLPGAIRGISRGDFSGLKKSPSEKTDFSELSATFQITNGVAQNQDLKLTSPLLRVTGAGAVQLPQRTVDYTVKPKLVASLEGQGAANATGIEIPVRISGPWDQPHYEPDLKGVLADPNKVVDTVKQLGKQLKGKNAGQIVDDVLGNKPGDSTTTGSTGSKAKELLNKFLKPPPQPQ